VAASRLPIAVFTEAGLDRQYYELCVLAELKNALRSGDIWVPGSRQFRDFEDYLLPTAAFESLDISNELPLTTGRSFDRYWTERETRLRRELEKVDSLAARHQLPDAEIVDGILKVTPLANSVPEEAETLMRQAYSLLPHRPWQRHLLSGHPETVACRDGRKARSALRPRRSNRSDDWPRGPRRYRRGSTRGIRCNPSIITYLYLSFR
jgi:hypothetical protein